MKRIALLALLLAGLSGCRPKKTDATLPAQPEETLQTDAQVPPDFLQFYARFHQDSLYQIAHISWPLAGQSDVQLDSSHTETRHLEWEAQKWRMHHAVDFKSGEFTQELQALADMMVIERIRLAEGNYGLERRFVKRPSGEWELIYYSDMHEMK